MASYDIKRCPACNQPYEKNFYSGKPKPEEKIRYGSPIKVCKYCKKEFIDSDYKEIALEGVPNKDDFKRFTKGTISYTIAAFVMAFFAYIFEFRFLPIVFILLGMIIIGSDIITYTKRLKHLEKETLASKERMSDPVYAKRLAEHGYHVPIHYLSSEEVKISSAE